MFIVKSPAIFFCLGFSWLMMSVASLAVEAPDYARDVRPILSSYCFKCHGQDEGARKAKLRLDVREQATKPAKSGAVAIVPGKPDGSEAIKRALSSDPEEVMPPPSAKHPLTAAQQDILQRWVAAGALYQDHWAFVAPKAAPIPAGKNKEWPRNEIDRFILARLEAEGLQPSPEADRATLIRRVSLDLTGLPPRVEEADAFINDTSPAAYETLVDRLLASPQYGERWARRWLDLARYADTNGYEKDRPRSMWPWRDWVVRALNADMPFDQFTIEQLAGDMLPSPTEDQLVATGFHRNTMLNEEGGIDPLEFRFHAMTDRVATTGTTWLGLTTGCAQCHTHKYDPILHTEYYQLMAFLDNADEPNHYLPGGETAEQRKQKEAEADRLEASLPNLWPVGKAVAKSKVVTPPLSEAYQAWLKDVREKAALWTAPKPAEMKTNSPTLVWLPDESILASGDFTKEDHYELRYANLPAGLTALKLDALTHESLPDNGPGMTFYEGTRGEFFIGDFSIMAGEQKWKVSSFLATEGKAALMGDENLQSGWGGSEKGGQSSVAVLVFEKPWPGGDMVIKFQSGRYYSASLAHFKISFTGKPFGVGALALSSELQKLLLQPSLKAAQEQQLRSAFLMAAPELVETVKKIKALRTPPRGEETLVMRERPANQPRTTYLHHRGEYMQPEQLVTAEFPAFLPSLPKDTPRNRLTFAQWLVAPENPLTARVTVNRAWAAIFGTGLVRTLGDFGFQGELPSHPELLDWLALDLQKQKWSMKKLHRMLVLSATYRQQSQVTPELLALDPQNRLLARGPRFRVEAEMVRDISLKASGLLSPKMFGPPVRPPQPASVTEAAYGGAQWNVSKGEDRYRRALYTFTKRSAPFAAANTFDAPSGEACVARRDLSNTPLQSLTLLNDEAFVEAAQALAQRAMALPTDDNVRLTHLFRRCLTRFPRDTERTKLLALLAQTRQRLAAGGKLGLATLLGNRVMASDAFAPRPSHFGGKAKAVIHLFMAGAPSHLELFDYKPSLVKYDGKPLPPSVIGGQRYAFIRPDANVMAPQFKFARYGQCGMELGETLPHLAKVVDDIALIRSVHTDQFNHAPAQIFFNTGFSQPGRPCIGSWATYGLGCDTKNLPSFVVMSTGSGVSGGTANWSSGFLPTSYTGVRLRNQGDPILDVTNPKGIDARLQRSTLDTMKSLNE
ncbi:MAG: DUF1553 domain-containing protein, partial [Verrucomicrobia bacterium]|nr:DUF1553 domain-containing protein [Verrucomicrobiota bacterium]